jgi:amino acid adenylation domain-containing protein
LQEQLPEYMVPSAFVLMSSMPLTPHGKINRKALPAPEQARPELADIYIAPRTQTEKDLASMFAHILGVTQVGLHDNFFELGGHSLLATQLLSRIREAFPEKGISLHQIFEFPTVAGLAREIEARAGADQDLTMPALVSIPRDEELPLSFAQQRLWFLDQLEPGSAVYNCPAAVRFSGALNIAALEQGFNEVVRRHETLRTSFSTRSGSPIQVIASSLQVPLPLIDLSGLPAARVAEEIQRLSLLEAQRAFDLSHGALLRTKLLRVSAEEHVVLLTMHHIISDGWSIGVLVKEVTALYVAHAKGTPAKLEPLPIQYADYAYWEREWLQGEILEEQLEYWKKQLAGATVLELPTDRPRPQVQTYRGAYESFHVDKELSSALNELSRRLEATLFMTLLATWQILLHRYSGQNDIVVGSPIANRHRPETERLIGFFVNTLALRTDMSGNPTFREVLRRVRKTALNAYAHQSLPFEKLIEELQPERDASHTPIVQVMFGLQNALETNTALDLSLSYVEGETGTAKSDLTLMLEETSEGMRGRLEYRRDLFDAGTIKRMLSHFENLLRGVVMHPDETLAQLPLLSETESRQLVEQGTNTTTVYPRESGIHELFAAQVERTPEVVAIIGNEERLSYRELNQRANQLARQLQTLGVVPETFVGISLERSEQLVIALLGVLKAGGIYVFLDASYPQERLALMLQDSGVKILITQERLKDRWPPVLETIVCLDTDAPEISQQHSENLNTPFYGGEQIAYVSYTSGSTGTPKGVAVPHQGVVRLVRDTNYASLTVDNVFLQLAPISFDASTLEIWGPLLNGGCCVLPARQILNAAELGHAIRHYGVNSLFLTTSLFNAIVGEDVRALDGLTQLLMGGEMSSVPHVRTAVEQLRQTQLIHVYGPTENTTFTSYFPIARTFDFATSSIPIGRPIANTQIYILDQELQPVPIGVVGELYIAGDGLARGYVAHPELTAEKFVPDPFSCRGGERLYRTGDLTRWLPTGEIEFIGRRDRQVKVRGFRIELGEVEAVLKRTVGVREAVVGLTRDRAGLVAYVVAEENLTEEQIRLSLQEQLPSYMTPGQVVLLERLPLTPTGKVDEQALRSFVENRERGTKGGAPETDAERIVAEAWGAVLGIEGLGKEADFFALGGHSLLATQAISRVRERVKAKIPLQWLFESPTVAKFAMRIDAAQQVDQVLDDPIVSVSREGELPLSFAQQRLWFLDQLEPGSAAYNVPTAVRFSGALNIAALEQSFNEVVRRHETLRTSFSTRTGSQLQIIASTLQVSLPIIDLSSLPAARAEAEIQRLSLLETQRTFDLSQGPLLRTKLLRVNAEEHVVLLTMHHIVSDGWSTGVLMREVTALYAAYLHGEASPLEKLPIQYADFAQWQRTWLQGEVFAAQLDYWRAELAGAPAMINLPLDRPRLKTAEHNAATHSLEIPADLIAALKRLGQEKDATLFMVLHTAFLSLLHYHTGEVDIVVGTDVANRNRIELEGLIGFFVNQLVLRVDVSGDPTFAELLRRVRKVALGAYAHQHLPFDTLVEMLNPERSMLHSPLFQVKLVLQNTPLPPMELTGLTLKLLEVEPDTAKFDLMFTLREVGNGLNCQVEYNRDIFDATTITRMAAGFVKILGHIVEHSAARLSELSKLLADLDREQQSMLQAELKGMRRQKLKNLVPKPIVSRQVM